ncbi:MAG: HyaD/HybD family hydrogenase maturation endopeptidase [Candidatus Thiodiazotropha sp. (ex Ctena orbiculata)]|uniref:HyaD/HybD family hydrogenase maturation endopeptidase n=1 Tax=Candidatus Thiodiazotropha taylori TaxID=2792791 RepID=A0A944MCR3_9GAMM|nr:HyaD/HybD family hydrogenase maturation endopeptidase [Candidatus Thiodiazotropha taylori]PUB81070.1 MAG: hydrogenase expression/formation protein [gamma proteobacterium symbiont of Ctena orbiculata]MBT2990279.1 HyaD/HybD family hydrogenase maturation endopeptidase [Candidatus Thiodiazotropha taylori]MBT2998207.1 HyaD/HybD family hydrogenase maturation endopeptidase [Candidatus Thiodiazotropha taylori]MBT3002505.1 HyaD/HybD family hydrogenase maturation endopeptidase [Candidatus Thiodiazotro
MPNLPNVLILGIGNLLWADEGFGVRALESLQRYYDFPANVRLLDGGTQGIYLVQHIREAEILVVFDAVDYGLPGGSLKRVEGDEVPNFLGAKKVSLHQTGFQEVLAMAEMLGDYPEHLLLVGVQPVELEDYGGSLHQAVRAQIEPAIAMALDYLSDFGIEAEQRADPLTPDIGAQGAISDIERYETERPSSQEACRVGDARVLTSSRFELAYRPVSVEQGAISVEVDTHLEKYRGKGER